jgi:hypothetical protein
MSAQLRNDAARDERSRVDLSAFRPTSRYMPADFNVQAGIGLDKKKSQKPHFSRLSGPSRTVWNRSFGGGGVYLITPAGRVIAGVWPILAK